MSIPAAADPDALPKDAIQEPPRSLWAAFRKIGPGLILAGSIVGTGELIATTSLGAEQGYTLLWLILLSCVIKVFIQTELGRYAITHGQTTLAALHTLPGPRLGTSWLCWLWLLMMLTTQAQIAAMEGLVGQAADMAFPHASQVVAIAVTLLIKEEWGAFLGLHPEYFWAALTGLAAILLLLSGGYRRLEHVTTALVALVTLMTVACVVGLPWTDYPIRADELAQGFAFDLPATGVALAFSTFGITGVGASELFAYPYWCIEKGYARAAGRRSDDEEWARRARGWLRVMKLDAWFSMLVFTTATVAFYLLGAAVLKPQGLRPEGATMIQTLSAMYVEPLGEWTRTAFLLGAWAVLFKTLYVATAANSRLTADFLDLTGLWPQRRPAARERVIRAFCVFYPLLALGLYFAIREPKGLVKVGGYAQGLMLPLIAGATLYLRRRDTDRRVGPWILTDILTVCAFAAIAAVALYSVVDLVWSAAWTRVLTWGASLAIAAAVFSGAGVLWSRRRAGPVVAPDHVSAPAPQEAKTEPSTPSARAPSSPSPRGCGWLRRPSGRRSRPRSARPAQPALRELHLSSRGITRIVIRLLLRARYASFIAVVALLGVLIYLDRHVTYEQSIQSFFAEDDPAVISYREAAAAFGNDQFVFVCYDDPELLSPAGMDRVAALARAIGPDQIGGVVRVETLEAMPVLWRVDDELLRLEALPAFLRRAALAVARKMVQNMGQADSTLTIGGAIRAAAPADLPALRERITGHPMLRNTLVNDSGATSALVVRLKSPEEHDTKETVKTLRERADAFAEQHQLGRPAVVGPPVLLADGFTSIEIDGRRLAFVGMLLIGLVTLTATRSIWWALVPLVAGWTVWAATEAVLAALEIKLSLSGGPLVAQIIVLTMPAASHLALHFRDDVRSAGDRRGAAGSTLRAVAVPILWCALTGTLGYGALLTSNVVPIRQFGAVLAVCTAVAAILTLAISPVAMIPPFRLEIPVRPGSASGTAAAMNRLTGWVLGHPRRIVFGTLAVVLPLAAGMWFLRYESNYVNAFKPDSRIVQDYRFVEARLGGIGLVYLVVPMGREVDVATLDKFRGLDAELAALRNRDGTPATAQVLSLETVLDPDGRLARLEPGPKARALATKLDLIAASPQAELLRGFWNPDAGRARVMVRLLEQQPAGTKEATFRRATALAEKSFGEADLAGLSHLLTQTTRGVIATQWSTFFWSAGSILLMLTITFRGPKLAVLALLPTLLAVGLVLGLMGWMGIKLDMATALVASVALGLSVDDTFHCLLQFRRHRAAAPFRESLFASYAVTGPGVLLSSLAVAIGFAVLRFSEFVPFSNFGTMVGIATAGSSLGNLVLLPACLALGQRRRSQETAPAAVGALRTESGVASDSGLRAE